MVLDGTLSIGELTAFILYLTRFFAPIQQLVQLYNTYQQGQRRCAKLRDLLAHAPVGRESPDADDAAADRGRDPLEHVTFGYDPARPVLRRRRPRHRRRRDRSRFVGPTGAGQVHASPSSSPASTTRPRARCSSTATTCATSRSTRCGASSGVVPQEPFLFAGTHPRQHRVRPARAPTREEILGACDAVGLLDLVDGCRRGSTRPCHERGVSLSSGERQLLALARAFLARPRVLVLDEATSNLDLRSETQVERGLDVLLEGRTAILIAHRLSTAMRADRIAVVDDGQLAEVGPHADLIARRPVRRRCSARGSSPTRPTSSRAEDRTRKRDGVASARWTACPHDSRS